ncbi:MAG: glycosyltransferase [Bacteroidota bacterium]|nr:glycosyltransferase [Bacteroidota bacterium]MDP4190290.1 glycosyltransferase [Bacteroidota bacterium]MDP4194291.1 glycosyltransferase [Bacteroidota bacterium]
MKIVIFGLTISSSWGNGHATIWRGLCRALVKRGHKITFFEKDVPYYASNRDLTELPGVDLVLYDDWEDILSKASTELIDAEVAMVTSYCPDSIKASDLVLASHVQFRIFYDLDTPVTLKDLSLGKNVPYIMKEGLGEFDLVLSYTGGIALDLLRSNLGARYTAALYGSADPSTHKPVDKVEEYMCDFSYLGTYALDRQALLERLFIEPARLFPEKRFIIGGSMYPQDFPWTNNIWYLAHIAPPRHPAFYCSSDFTLNITRGAMAEMGYCPSGRLFEAAACGVPIISDSWTGLDYFFEPGKEIIIVENSSDVIDALNMSKEKRKKISESARERVLKDHIGEKRAIEFETILDEYYSNRKLRSENYVGNNSGSGLR